MKIAKIEYIPIRVPKIGTKDGQFKTALGNNPFGDTAIVLMHTDDDKVGIGEVSSIWDSYGSGLVRSMGQKIADSVIGLDIYRITEALARMDKAVAWSRNALCLKAGIEMAMYDLIGKTKDLPVYELLGGKRRDAIPLSHSVAMGSLEERVAQVEKHVKAGFKTVKVKVGLDFENDLATVRAIRRQFGNELGIRVDANMGWRDEKALIYVAKELEKLGVLSIEQPFGPDELDKLASLRTRCPIPLMLDESIWGPEDALRAIRKDAGDIFNVYVSESGGLYKAMEIANMCSLAGVGFAIGSMPEFGIGTAAEVHLGAAAPSIDHPSDVIGNQYFADDIINETLPLKDGCALTLDKPGLGVSLNWDKVNKYRTDKK